MENTFKIEATNSDAVSISDIVKDTEVKKAPVTFVDVQTQIILNPRDVQKEARDEVHEAYEVPDSFIPDADTNAEGENIAYKEVKAKIEERTEELENMLTNQILDEAKKMNKNTPILKTAWSNGKVSIKNSYFLIDNKIVLQQLKRNGNTTSYTVGVPSIKGLAPFRAEIFHNEDMEQELKDQLRNLHNDFLLTSNGLQPQSEAYYELADVNESNDRRRDLNQTFKGKKIWVSFFDGFIQAVKNEHNTETGTPVNGNPDKDTLADSDLF